MIPSPNVDLSLQLERPPSRQRNMPIHLNSDLTLELNQAGPDGQLSPDVERKWAHYASTPRPQSRHKSPPDAVFLDLPPEPLQGDRDPQPLPPDENPLPQNGSPEKAHHQHPYHFSQDGQQEVLPPSMPTKSSADDGGGGGGGMDASLGNGNTANGSSTTNNTETPAMPPPPQFVQTPMTNPSIAPGARPPNASNNRPSSSNPMASHGNTMAADWASNALADGIANGREQHQKIWRSSDENGKPTPLVMPTNHQNNSHMNHSAVPLVHVGPMLATKSSTAPPPSSEAPHMQGGSSSSSSSQHQPMVMSSSSSSSGFVGVGNGSSGGGGNGGTRGGASPSCGRDYNGIETINAGGSIHGGGNIMGHNLPLPLPDEDDKSHHPTPSMPAELMRSARSNAASNSPYTQPANDPKAQMSAMHRPLTPDDRRRPEPSSRPQSGKVRASSVAGSPRGVRSPFIAGSSSSGSASTGAFVASSHGQASHAHARALQQQAQAAATAAAAASASYKDAIDVGDEDPVPTKTVGARPSDSSTSGHSNGRPAGATSSNGHDTGRSGYAPHGNHGPTLHHSAATNGIHRPSASRPPLYQQNYSATVNQQRGSSAGAMTGGSIPGSSFSRRGVGNGTPPSGNAFGSAMAPSAQPPGGAAALAATGSGMNGSRLEVESLNGSRPSTTESSADMSARGFGGGGGQQTKRAQRASKIAGAYGTGSTPLAYAAFGNAKSNRPGSQRDDRHHGPPGQSARGGSGGTPIAQQLREAAHQQRSDSAGTMTGSMNGARGATSSCVRRSAGSASSIHPGHAAMAQAAAATQQQSHANAAQLLRVPSADRVLNASGVASGVSGALGQNGVGRGGENGLMSPLPFESSLAPDFLALFANSGWE